MSLNRLNLYAIFRLFPPLLWFPTCMFLIIQSFLSVMLLIFLFLVLLVLPLPLVVLTVSTLFLVAALFPRPSPSYLLALLTAILPATYPSPTFLPQYPVNLALLHHFFDNDTLGAFSGDTLLPQPLSVQLPPMKFFNHSFDDKLATSHALSYQLDKVVNASKADAHIFRSIIDPVLTGDLVVPSDYFFTPPGYLATATAAVVRFNLLFSLWIAYRLRLTLAALAALLTHTPPLHARTLHPFLIASLPPSTPLPSLPSVYSVLPPDFSTYVLVFLVFVYVGHRLWHCRAPRFGSGPSFDIYLEVKASGKCVFIKLQTVTDCP